MLRAQFTSESDVGDSFLENGEAQRFSVINPSYNSNSENTKSLFIMDPKLSRYVSSSFRLVSSLGSTWMPLELTGADFRGISGAVISQLQLLRDRGAIVDEKEEQDNKKGSVLPVELKQIPSTQTFHPKPIALQKQITNEPANVVNNQPKNKPEISQLPEITKSKTEKSSNCILF